MKMVKDKQILMAAEDRRAFRPFRLCANGDNPFGVYG